MVQRRDALRDLVLDIGLDDVSRLLRCIGRIFSNVHISHPPLVCSYIIPGILGSG